MARERAEATRPAVSLRADPFHRPKEPIAAFTAKIEATQAAGPLARRPPRLPDTGAITAGAIAAPPHAAAPLEPGPRAAGPDLQGR